MSLRLAVLASGRGSNLGALLLAIEGGVCDAEIAVVVSDKRACAALSLAEERGIPTTRVPFRRDEREAWDAELTDAIAAHEPELVVLAGFMRIVGSAFLARFGGRTINVHPALLPAFPGLHAPQQAIDAGVALSGCTVHLVDAGVDTGPILAQGAVPVLPGDDAETLHARIQRIEHRLLPRVVHAFARGELRAGPPVQISLTPSSTSDGSSALTSPLRLETST